MVRFGRAVCDLLDQAERREWWLTNGRGTYAAGRPESARRILETFARFADGRMLPNVFPGSGERPAYNTVDAALWYNGLVAMQGLAQRLGGDAVPYAESTQTSIYSHGRYLQSFTDMDSCDFVTTLCPAEENVIYQRNLWTTLCTTLPEWLQALEPNRGRVRLTNSWPGRFCIKTMSCRVSRPSATVKITLAAKCELGHARGGFTAGFEIRNRIRSLRVKVAHLG